MSYCDQCTNYRWCYLDRWCPDTWAGTVPRPKPAGELPLGGER